MSEAPQVEPVSVEGDAFGEEPGVILELGPGARVFERAALPEVSSFDPPEHFVGFQDAGRWVAVSPPDQRLLNAPRRTGISPELPARSAGASTGDCLLPKRRASEIPEACLANKDLVSEKRVAQEGKAKYRLSRQR